VAGAVTPAGGAGGDEETAAWMRAEMGRDLKRRRRAAGLSQVGLAEQTGYSQSTVAHAENGLDDVGEGFWRAADRALGTGGLLAGLHDEVRECLEPGRRAAVRAGDAGPEVRCGPLLKSAEPDRALAGYRRLGWPVTARGDVLELLAGKTADVLEVGRPAGMVAAGAWLESGGDERAVRALPRLPAPEGALAVISAGERWYFLVRTGFPLPWRDGGGRRPATAGGDGEAEIRWHSAGGRVPLPPSKAGQAAARWAYLPDARLLPAPPLAVLDLLSWAVAVTRHPGRLVLPGRAAVAADVPQPQGRAGQAPVRGGRRETGTAG
jgi:Helix-turn-helix domain